MKPPSALAHAQHEAAEAMRQRLIKHRVKLKVQGLGLGDALTVLSAAGNVNILVDWPALEQIGITKTTPISVDLSNVPLESALTNVFEKAAGRAGVLGYTVDGGVLEVSGGERLDAMMCLRIYNIRDLLAGMERRRDGALRRRFAGRLPAEIKLTGEDSDSGLFGDDGMFADDDGGSSPPEHANHWEGLASDDLGRLTDLIRSMVRSESWSPARVAELSELAGLLLVRQTEQGHREVATLLAMLRSADRPVSVIAPSSQPERSEMRRTK